MFSKKGQDEGKSVGVLILVIALFMVLYMIFIPPADREQLLNPGNTSTTISSNTLEKLELLSETPGLVSPEIKSITEHNLMPASLYIKTEPKTTSLAQSLTVNNALFTKSSPTLYFNIDKRDLSKLTLFFSVSEASGDLILKINGNQFSSEPVSPGIKLVQIPLTYIQDKNNELVFEVSSPGIAFWATNKYVLSDIGLKQEYEMINSREERQFTIPSIEKDSIESSTLSYFQVCNMKLPKGTVPLKIYLNDNPVPVISTPIRCVSTKQSAEIDKNGLKSGQNKILFVLEESGDFTFNELKLENKAQHSDYPQYSFGISKTQYEEIQSKEKKLQLELYLEDDKKTKNARISINSQDVFMQEKLGTFTLGLKTYVEQGTNFIRIVPNNEFVIAGLKVTLQ